MNEKELREICIEKVNFSPYGYLKSLRKYEKEIRSVLNLKETDFKTLLYLFINKMDYVPICPVCKKNNTKLKNINKGFQTTCSNLCNSKYASSFISEEVDQKSKVSKMKETNIKRYGHALPLQRESIKKKQEQTMLERYGHKHAANSPELFEKQKRTTFQRFGKNYYFETEESKKKSSENQKRKLRENFYRNYFIEKYGVDHYTKTEKYFKDYLGQFNLQEFYDNPETFLDGRTLKEITNDLGISVNVAKRILDLKDIEYKAKRGRSKFERDVKEFLLKNLTPKDIAMNCRDFLRTGKELDFIIKSKNLAIECNGLYWHSDRYKEPKFHKEKTDECIEKGIQLIQIPDKLYYNNIDCWHSLLLSKMGLIEEKIHARKCKIEKVKFKEAKKFLNENHIQGGGASASHNIALSYEDEIVAVATFKKSRFDKKYTYELIRFATKNYVTVMGGFSKLMKFFTRNHLETGETIISYSDRFWSTGNVYKRNGFELIRTTEPNYFWTGGSTMLSRYECQPHKLKKKFSSENVISENDFMRNVLKMSKFYNSGNDVWVCTKKEAGFIPPQSLASLT